VKQLFTDVRVAFLPRLRNCCTLIIARKIGFNSSDIEQWSTASVIEDTNRSGQGSLVTASQISSYSNRITTQTRVSDAVI